MTQLLGLLYGPSHRSIRFVRWFAAILCALAFNAHCDALGEQPSTQSSFIWALIGGGTSRLTAERVAGINAKVVRLSWKDFAPASEGDDDHYVQAKRREFDQLHAAGFRVIADIGLQDTPRWLHREFADSRYVDQYGDAYDPREVDSGDANLVFNDNLRAAAERYFDRLFQSLGSRIDFIRVGGGHWGELTYPAATYHGHANCYWAFDATALKSSPSAGWRPGDASPHGEAAAFARWYMGQLVNFQKWQIHAVRRRFAGPIIVLYPSWGIRPGQLQLAIDGNLSGKTSAEINGEVPRGFDFARQISAIDDSNVIASSTWLDADGSGDGGTDQRLWSPIHYLAELVHRIKPSLRLFGENTGQGSAKQMAFTVSQAQRFGLCGMAWFKEDELGERGLATLQDYAKQVSGTANAR